MGYESNFILIYRNWFIIHKTLIWHCSAPKQLLAWLAETTPNDVVKHDRQVLQGRARSSERKEGGYPTSVSSQRELRSASELKVYLTFFFTRMKCLTNTNQITIEYDGYFISILHNFPLTTPSFVVLQSQLDMWLFSYKLLLPMNNILYGSFLIIDFSSESWERP